jgi:hypothetical protein
MVQREGVNVAFCSPSLVKVLCYVFLTYIALSLFLCVFCFLNQLLLRIESLTSKKTQRDTTVAICSIALDDYQTVARHRTTISRMQ